MQRLTPDYLSRIGEVTIEKDQTQMIRSKKLSLMLNEAPVPEYHVAKRVGPSLPPISIDSIQKAFLKSFCETKKSIIDMAMISISSSCYAASTDIPDPLSPLLPIVHCLRQVFRTTFRILT